MTPRPAAIPYRVRLVIKRLQKLIDGFTKRFNLRRDWYLIVLAAGVGSVTAIGAITFVELLHAAEHFVVGVYSRTPWWVIPIPLMVGALITGVLVHLFAREAKGHGVPEVMDAIYRKSSRIRPRVALVKSIASVATIGSGGSAGAEGPIVQIGSAIGSGLSQLLRIPRDQAATLLGCGAAAGIASVFNAPIAGIFFVLEILLRDFSLRTFTPIVVSSVISTMLTQAYYGKNDAIFAVTGELSGYQFTIAEFPMYLALGLVCGCVAVGFIRALYFSEDLAERVKVHPIIKPVIGALLLGLLGIGYLQVESAAIDAREETPSQAAVPVDPHEPIDVEHAPDPHDAGVLPPFFGNGYATITALLRPASYDAPRRLVDAAPELAPAGPSVAAVEPGSPIVGAVPQEPRPMVEPVSTELWLLLILVLCKCFATCFTLGSGGSGGVFAPSLFLGAAAGATHGVALEHLGLLPEASSPAAYALVGMAAVVAATTHAPLTAILILFELTRDVYVLLPIMLAAVVATLFAQSFMRDSIYSLKLRRRGVLVGTMADLTILRRYTARQITPVPHVRVHPEDPLSKLLELRGNYHIADFVVTDHDGHYVGMVTAQDMRTALIEREAIPYLLVEELMRADLPTVHPDDTLDRVLDKFSRHDVGSLALSETRDERAIAGLVTRSRLMRRYQEALRES